MEIRAVLLIVNDVPGCNIGPKIEDKMYVKNGANLLEHLCCCTSTKTD